MYPGTKRGLDTEFSNFVKKYPRSYMNLVNDLMPNLLRQIEEKKAQYQAGDFVANWKNLRTYINQEAWTEEFTVQKNKQLYGTTTQQSAKQFAADKRASLDRMEDLANRILQGWDDSKRV